MLLGTSLFTVHRSDVLTSINPDVDIITVVADGSRRAAAVDDVIVEVAADVLVVVIVVIIISGPIAGRPLHLVLLLEAPTGVGEPRRDLRQCHLGDDRQHDLLALGRVRVLDVLVQPGFQRARRFAGSVLSTDIESTIAASRLHVWTTITNIKSYFVCFA